MHTISDLFIFSQIYLELVDHLKWKEISFVFESSFLLQLNNYLSYSDKFCTAPFLSLLAAAFEATVFIESSALGLI